MNYNISFTVPVSTDGQVAGEADEQGAVYYEDEEDERDVQGANDAFDIAAELSQHDLQDALQGYNEERPQL